MHQSYLEPVSESEQWIVAYGGRCYKRRDAQKSMMTKVKCLSCVAAGVGETKHTFGDLWAFQCHHDAVH